jgi:hypothetical protein
LSTSQNIQDDFINQLWASVSDPYACGTEPSFGHISSSLGFGQRKFSLDCIGRPFVAVRLMYDLFYQKPRWPRDCLPTHSTTSDSKAVASTMLTDWSPEPPLYQPEFCTSGRQHCILPAPPPAIYGPQCPRTMSCLVDLRIRLSISPGDKGLLFQNYPKHLHHNMVPDTMNYCIIG